MKALVKLPVSAIQRIFISPNYGRDQTLLALVENKLYKSEDGGGSWVGRSLQMAVTAGLP